MAKSSAASVRDEPAGRSGTFLLGPWVSGLIKWEAGGGAAAREEPGLSLHPRQRRAGNRVQSRRQRQEVLDITESSEAQTCHRVPLEQGQGSPVSWEEAGGQRGTGAAGTSLGSPGHPGEQDRGVGVCTLSSGPCSHSASPSALRPQQTPFLCIVNELQLYHFETTLLHANSIQAVPSAQNTLLYHPLFLLSLYKDGTTLPNSAPDSPLPTLCLQPSTRDCRNCRLFIV